MKKFYLFFVFLLLAMGWTVKAQAEDVVYLKDGSIIHGTITEEVPGVSIKIATADGNVFVYKVRQISKITHGDAAAAPAEDDQEGAPDTTVVVVKHRHAPRFVNDFVSDPTASFSVGSVFIGLGVMNPSVVNQVNNWLTGQFGSAYDFTPVAYTGDLGLAWFTNHIALKWTGTYGFNWENQTYYYGTYGQYYYSLNELVEVYGSELEADLSLDDVQTSKTRPNARRVASVYLPLMVGYWQSNFTTYDSYGNSDTLTGTAASFGTGIGGRFIDENHNMFDMQFVYRWSNSTTLKDPYGNYLIQNGTKVNSSVAGLGFSINYGITF